MHYPRLLPLSLAGLIFALVSMLLLGQSDAQVVDQPSGISSSAPLINRTASASSPLTASLSDPKAEARILDQYGKLPLSFEVNQGQTDGRVKFLSRTGGYTLFLTGDEAVFQLTSRKADLNRAKVTGVAHASHPSAAGPKAGGVLRMILRNANPAAQVTGVDRLAGASNYFVGNDPAKWRTSVPTYAKVKYERIYSGIDLLYYGNQRQLEYDFIVAPGADPRRIEFDLRGAKRIRRDSLGALVLNMSEGEIRWQKPVAYQEKDGKRREITARYCITAANHVTFELAKYDTDRPLYIDPLIYATYLGGSAGDEGTAIAADSAGNVYVTGYTSSANFPTANPLQAALGGGSDAFVSKLNPTGSALVYSTYLGGSSDDYGFGIAVNSSGDSFVVGQTSSINFPVTPGAFQTTLGSGVNANAFVAEFNPTGSALVYSTYLGGSGGDVGYGIALDGASDAYVTGQTCSTNFPTVNPLQPAYGGGGSTCGDAFVTEINPTGSALVYSTYLGGSNTDYGSSIAVDSSGNAYVTGLTCSTNFPTQNPFQPDYGGAQAQCGDAFVTRSMQPAQRWFIPPISAVPGTTMALASPWTARATLTSLVTQPPPAFPSRRALFRRSA